MTHPTTKIIYWIIHHILHWFVRIPLLHIISLHMNSILLELSVLLIYFWTTISSPPSLCSDNRTMQPGSYGYNCTVSYPQLRHSVFHCQKYSYFSVASTCFQDNHFSTQAWSLVFKTLPPSMSSFLTSSLLNLV